MIVSRYINIPSTPRVVICGMGLYGGLVAQTLTDVGYEIVGAYNRAGPKIGQDIGQATKQNRNYGVIVEDIATADLKKVEADVGIVTQGNDLGPDMPTYTRLMEAGINVISLATEAYYPYGNDPETAEKIDALARKNRVTFTGTGIHDMSRIWSGIIACGQCTKIDSIHHESLTDAADQQRPDQLLLPTNMMQIGRTVEEYMNSGIHKARLWPIYTTTLEHVLTVLGYTVVEKKSVIEPIVWDEPYESEYLNTTIPAGRVLGTRNKGFVKTAEGVTAKLNFEARMIKPDEEDHMHWRVEGKPRCEIYIKRKDADYTNSACLVGRVKDVIGAPPGIVLLSDYGPLQGPELVPKYRL